MSNGAKPYPKRWWWTRRIGIAIAALFLVTVVAWAAWHVHATAALDAQLDAIAAAGEPLEWAQFKPAPIPDNENAALLYRRSTDLLPSVPDYPSIERNATKAEILAAEKAWQQESDRIRRQESMVWDLLDHPDFRREHARDLQALLSDSAEARALWREARAKPNANWLSETGEPFSFIPIYRYRETYLLVLLAAVDAHERGDDAEAAEHLLNATAFARAVGQSPSLWAAGMAESKDARLAETVEEIAPTLRIGSTPKAASPQQIDRITQHLFEDAARTARFRRDLVFERAWRHGFLQGFRRNAPDATSADVGIREFTLPHWPVFAPMYKLEHARMLRRAAAVIAAFDAGSYPKARKLLPSEPRGKWDRHNVSRRLSHELTSDCESTIRRHFRHRTLHRMAATALAIRRYELARGRRPGTLAELVPDYLPAVPIDPFTDPPFRLAYRPEADPPMLYSVGRNDEDDGGAKEAPDDAYPMTPMAFESAPDDIPFYLDGDRRLGKADWTDPTLPWSPGPGGMGMPMGPATPTSAPASRPWPAPAPAPTPPPAPPPAGVAP